MKTIQEGARKLLVDSVRPLGQFQELEYVVIGGWCPVLRNETNLSHPGTLDVDLLFRESYRSGELEPVIEALMGEGFVPSAKHPFQLMKKYEISGKCFIFHIDLLHPNMLEEGDPASLFVDHLDLDVPLSEEELATRKMMSIVLPNSEVIFRERLHDTKRVDDVSFNLISFDGMFITKMDSCQKQKRERDSFDIYLGVKGGSINRNRIDELARSDSRIRTSLSSFKKYLAEKGDTFDRNVATYCSVEDRPSELLRTWLEA